jgi:hypothetical protein
LFAEYGVRLIAEAAIVKEGGHGFYPVLLKDCQEGIQPQLKRLRLIFPHNEGKHKRAQLNPMSSASANSFAMKPGSKQ